MTPDARRSSRWPRSWTGKLPARYSWVRKGCWDAERQQLGQEMLKASIYRPLPPIDQGFKAFGRQPVGYIFESPAVELGASIQGPLPPQNSCSEQQRAIANMFCRNQSTCWASRWSRFHHRHSDVRRTSEETVNVMATPASSRQSSSKFGSETFGGSRPFWFAPVSAWDINPEASPSPKFTSQAATGDYDRLFELAAISSAGNVPTSVLSYASVRSSRLSSVT